MAIEEIVVDRQRIVTLRELLRPGLRAVFVGLNPSPVSVNRGHYYQGRHGRLFWNRLSKSQLVPLLPSGVEDDAAFEYGYGFADLVRRPTASGDELSTQAKAAAVSDLVDRLRKTGDRPPVVFTYKEPWILARVPLESAGYRVFRMPSPYAKKDSAQAMLMELQVALARTNSA